jgi:probable DNA metabolism protein
MRITLVKLFSVLNSPANLFDDEKDVFYLAAGEQPCQIEKTDLNFTTAYFSKRFNVSLLEGTARILFELSFNAFDNILHAWMSELPVEREIIYFGRRILAAAQSFNNFDEKRSAAKKAANDRGNADTQAVLNAASKVQFEVHRMMGLLRFSPNKDGEFIARCEPDHFILPCLGEYFTARFGDTPWSIIDEKRELSLRRIHGRPAKIDVLTGIAAEDSAVLGSKDQEDDWETLWKHYHKTINNEDRDNPDLQRQLMPKRYWKYLPEM